MECGKLNTCILCGQRFSSDSIFQDVMNLLAITASQNVGHIDWEPYIPMIFTRLLRSLDLPVCYKSMKSARNQTLWSSSVASEYLLLEYDFFW